MKLVRFAVVLSVVAWLLGGLGQAAGPVIVKLGTAAPDGSIWHQVLKQLGADWNQASQGSVNLRIFAGTQGDEPTMIRKMRVNQLQAASLTSIGLSDIDEAFNVFGIPMFFDSYDELRHVMDALTPTLRAKLEEKGFVLINWGSAGWVQVFSKEPVRRLEDMKNLKIFTSAGDDRMVQWYKNNGFKPVPLALTDMMTSLQTGMIDAAPFTPLAALSFQWYKQTPYMLQLGLGPMVGATVMTTEAWDEVPEVNRATLLDMAAKAQERLRSEIPKQDASAIAEMEKRGLTVTKPESSAGQDQWRKAAEEFAASMRGVMVPADVYDMAMRERDSYRRQPAKGGQP